MKILIADDHHIVRVGTRVLLQSVFINAQFIEVDNHETLCKEVQRDVFDLLLLDISLKQLTTVGFIKQLLIWRPGLKIIILSQQAEELFARHFIKAGVMAYIDKKRSHEMLIPAVNMVMQNRVFLTEELKQEILRLAVDNDAIGISLSDREIDVLGLMLKGYTTQDICQELRVQPTTVSTYKNRLYEKLKTSNIIDLRTVSEVLELFRVTGNTSK